MACRSPLVVKVGGKRWNIATPRAATDTMAPSFMNLKQLRRRSKASFKTERSADESSEASHNTTPTSGSVTPPSIGAESDPALHLQLKEQSRSQSQSPPQSLSQSPPPSSTAIPRPQAQPYPNGGSNRYSVSGMVGLGSPVQGGKGPSLPVSQYSPRVTNVPDSSWVSGRTAAQANAARRASIRYADGR